MTDAPNETATGDPTVGRARISRRAVLAAGGAGVVGLGALAAAEGGLGRHLAAHRLTPESTGTRRDGPILVVVTLYGGNDGLNTVVPYQDPAYAARGTAALDLASLLPLADGFALHPSMPGFRKLWQQGHLAVVHGVGYPQPNLSHFVSMDIWQSASLDPDTNSGWIGRWLDTTGTDPLRALSIGPTLPLSLSGDTVQGSALPPPPLVLPGAAADQSAYAAMQVVGRDQPTLVTDACRSGAGLLTVQHTLAPVLDGAGSATGSGGSGTNLEGGAAASLAITQGGGASAPASVLSEQLSLVATMIEAAVPTKVYAVSYGGFDTHTDQLSTQATLLANLDGALSAFLAQVEAAPHGRPVVVVVHTEFGRRVAGNSSSGTDHGAANAVFVAGSVVRGGFYGEPPSLTALDRDGNQVFNVDFRRVYATLLAGVLGAEPNDLLGGSFSPLPLLA